MKLLYCTLFFYCIVLINATDVLTKKAHRHPPGAADPNFHHHMTCVDKHCDDHHSTCRMHLDPNHMHGECTEPDHCDRMPACNETNHHDHECCCKTTQCVTDLLAASHIQMDTVDCLGAMCDLKHQTCVFETRDHHARQGWCEDRHKCDHEYWLCADRHGHLTNHHECCCLDKNCITTVLGITTTAAPVPTTARQHHTHHSHAPTTALPHHTNAPTTGVPVVHTNAPTVRTSTSAPLYCPVCTDDFIADCQSNTMCKGTEGCLLQITAGKLKTGCAEIHDCEYHERIGDGICCKDKNCTDVAFRNMHTLSYTCPSCQQASDPKACLASQTKCSYLSKGCMITSNMGGVSSGCNTHAKACQTAEASNSVLCNVNPIPFAFQPNLQCSFCCHRNESTCLLDALGIHDATTILPPTAAHTAGTTASSCHNIEDATFNCTEFDQTFQLCSHTSGLMAHLSVTKCRKTCGLCGAAPGATAPSVGVSSAGPVTAATTTKSVTAQTTKAAQFPCIDHDINNNCAMMSSVLCATQNTHGKNYAIANCAKTCNLCKEYFRKYKSVEVCLFGILAVFFC
ncbi:uncharacterized protein [Argopecten irradians]|uniref:uncharacterized protein isoform X2 n=1 Tax=Argopecten irradians TaxID=31199 RepID=UPI003720E675